MVRHLKQPEKVGVLTGNTTLGIVAMAEVQWGDETLFEPVGILEEFKANRDQSFETCDRKKSRNLNSQVKQENVGSSQHSLGKSVARGAGTGHNETATALLHSP